MPFLIGAPLLRKIPDPPLGHLFKMHIVLGAIKSVISLRGCNASVIMKSYPPHPHLNPMKLRGM